VAAIAAVVVLVIFALGTYVKGAFQDTCNELAKAPTSGEGCEPAS